MKILNTRLKHELMIAEQALKQVNNELELHELKKDAIKNRKSDSEERIRDIKKLAEALEDRL